MTACPTCGGDAHVEELPETAMQAGDVVVRVAGLARTTCDAGHVHVVPDGGAAAGRGAVAEQLQTAVQRGVVRRRLECGDCGAELVLPPLRSERVVPVDVAGRVLTITVEAPFRRCPDCAREQLTPDGADAVPVALDAAVAEAG